MAESNNVAYFDELTGVRALAAIMVYVHHFNPIPQKYHAFYQFGQELHVGVTFFFVLSGFLIAYRYSNMHDFYFKGYMTNRMARIYPMYFLLTTLTFLVQIINSLNSIDKRSVFVYIANITFVKGFFSSMKFSLVGQGWSLTVEEMFYVTAPIFFYLINRKKGYILGLPFTLMILGFSLVGLFNIFPFYGLFSHIEFMMNYTFLGRCCEFFTGIALALLLKEGKNIQIRYTTYIGLTLIVFWIFVLSILPSPDFGIRHPLGMIINTLFLPAFGIIIFYNGLINEHTIISRILKSRMLVLLGKSSYVFYLIHMGIIRDVLPTFTRPSLDYIFKFIALQIISILLFKMIEEPVNKLIRQYFNGRVNSKIRLT